MLQKILQNLSKRKDIIVKAADKGGALVVWRADLYQKEALRQLSDTSFYTPYSKMAAVSDDLGRVARERGIEGQNLRCCAVSSKTFRTAVAWSRDQEDKIWLMPYLDLFF